MAVVTFPVAVTPVVAVCAAMSVMPPMSAWSVMGAGTCVGVVVLDSFTNDEQGCSPSQCGSDGFVALHLSVLGCVLRHWRIALTVVAAGLCGRGCYACDGNCGAKDKRDELAVHGLILTWLFAPRHCGLGEIKLGPPPFGRQYQRNVIG